MRKTIVVLAIAGLLTLSVSTDAGVTVNASCEDGIVTCHVFISWELEPYQGVVLQWRYGNVCYAPYSPLPIEMLAMPPENWFVNYTITFPAPDTDEWVVYRAFFVDQQGELHPADGAGYPPYDWETCANPPPLLSRGYLVDLGTMPPIWIEHCEDTCWFTFPVFTDGLPPGSWESLVDSPFPVNLWGTPIFDEMPGGSGIIATAIEALPLGEPCETAVESDRVSWGTLKVMFH